MDKILKGFIRIFPSYWDGWCKRVHKLSRKKRIELIKKLNEKYSDKKYIESELQKGYEPRKSLYTLLYEYAMRYGTEADYYKTSSFSAGAYEIDNYFVVDLLIGQGSAILVKEISEILAEREFPIKSDDANHYFDVRNKRIAFVKGYDLAFKKLLNNEPED